MKCKHCSTLITVSLGLSKLCMEKDRVIESLRNLVEIQANELLDLAEDNIDSIVTILPDDIRDFIRKNGMIW